MTTKKLGKITEMQCQVELMKLGCSVSVPLGDDDRYDLSQSNKKHVVEFNMGFNENGALRTCAHCNGFININSNLICVAEQL